MISGTTPVIRRAVLCSNTCIRGNHETGGEFKQGRIREDIVDLEVVVGYLKSKFGYKIDMLIGHSRGSVVAIHWICNSEDGRHVSAMVNVSGRYRMPVSKECSPSRMILLSSRLVAS